MCIDKIIKLLKEIGAVKSFLINIRKVFIAVLEISYVEVVEALICPSV